MYTITELWPCVDNELPLGNVSSGLTAKHQNIDFVCSSNSSVPDLWDFIDHWLIKVQGGTAGRTVCCMVHVFAVGIIVRLCCMLDVCVLNYLIHTVDGLMWWLLVSIYNSTHGIIDAIHNNINTISFSSFLSFMKIYSTRPWLYFMASVQNTKWMWPLDYFHVRNQKEGLNFDSLL